MKKILIAMAAVLGIAGLIHAAGFEVNKASYTATADSLKRLPGTARGSILSAVIVSTASPGIGLIIYDSQLSATTTFMNINLAVPQSIMDLNVVVSSGITYTTSGANNGVTILWR